MSDTNAAEAKVTDALFTAAFEIAACASITQASLRALKVIFINYYNNLIHVGVASRSSCDRLTADAGLHGGPASEGPAVFFPFGGGAASSREAMVPFVVLIDQVGQNGLPSGTPSTQVVASEEEGLAVMRSAAEQASCRMVYSLYDHDRRMLFSYTSKTGSDVPLEATPL